MNILILNWRDIKNPRSGGAEILTHEISKHWIKLGHKVTQFSSAFEGGLSEEEVDGIRIIRRGYPDARYLFFSVHFLAFWYYRKMFRGKVDVVIDEIHGLPFFTPWYVKEKKVVLICEVANQLWIKMFGRFFGTLGRLAEHFYLKSIYKDVPFMAISNSTKKELVDEGVPGKNITVLPMGLSIEKNIRSYKREKIPTLIFVGRLSPAKGIEDAILAVKALGNKVKGIKLWILGQGEKKYESHLKKMVIKLGIRNKVIFFGFVSNKKKFELLSKSHILLAPSMKEGWGLTVPEAGLMGTPAIGYDVEGLREVIKNNKTGYLTQKNTHKDLVFYVYKALNDRKEYKKISEAARRLSQSYSWENTAREALKVLSR